MEDSKKALHEKTKLWEEKEQVLGHTQRSEASRPRTILSVPTVWDDDEDEVEDEEAAEPGNSSERSLRPLKQLFTSKSWSVRQSVQRAYNALGTFQVTPLASICSLSSSHQQCCRSWKLCWLRLRSWRPMRRPAQKCSSTFIRLCCCSHSLLESASLLKLKFAMRLEI